MKIQSLFRIIIILATLQFSINYKSVLGKDYDPKIEGIGISERIDSIGIYELKTLALAGNRDAQASLGYAYYFGKMVNQDPAAAFGWYYKAALQGVIFAAYEVAWMYDSGNGVEQDYKKAFQWLIKAAEGGDISAQEEVVRRYSDGIKEVEVSPAEAKRWKEIAVAAGSVKMVVALVRDYLRDSTELRKDLHDQLIQAALSSVHARDLLVTLNIEGKCIPRNAAEAYFWILVNKATNKAVYLSIENTLVQELKDSERATVIKRAQEWVTKYKGHQQLNAR
jgi:TPR repeat protein